MTANPFAFPLDVQRQALQVATGTLDRSRAVPDRVETMAEVEVGTTPSEVVYRQNKLELHRYDPEAVGASREHDVPILVVYALINRPYILDLQPNRSVVRRLLEAGFTVYLIDWGEPSQLDTALSLADYVDRYLDDCVDVVREAASVDDVHLLGYCMGGTMSAVYAALYPAKVRTLGLMAAGLCFAGTGGVLEQWGDEDFYDPGAVADTFGNVPAEFLDVGFALMDPVNNYVAKYVNLYENLDDEEFVENFARMERWLSDGIDVAGTVYREFLEEIYQDNALYENDLVIGDRRVDLAELDLPILQIVGEYDHLVPPEASKPFNDRVPSDDVTTKEFATGHIGLSVSRSSHRDLWPSVAEWYVERTAVEEESAAGAEAAAEAGTDETEPAGAADAARAEDVETDAETDAGTGAETDAEADVETEDPEAAATDDLESVDGIGPSYAEDLRAAGVTGVAELAAADPAELAAASGIGEGRLRDFVARAAEAADDTDVE